CSGDRPYYRSYQQTSCLQLLLLELLLSSLPSGLHCMPQCLPICLFYERLEIAFFSFLLPPRRHYSTTMSLFFSFLLDLPQILFAAVVRHSLNSFHTESALPSDLSSAFNLTSSQYSALVSFCLSFHNLHLSIGLSFFFLGRLT